MIKSVDKSFDTDTLSQILYTMGVKVFFELISLSVAIA